MGVKSAGADSSSVAYDANESAIAAAEPDVAACIQD